MALFASPVRLEAPRGVECCEHCLTVTWAGRAACGCDFGRLSTDEGEVSKLYEKVEAAS